MNIKIKELISKSNGLRDGTDIRFTETDLEKFVELIVLESEEVIDYISTQHLLEHFGLIH